MLTVPQQGSTIRIQGEMSYEAQRTDQMRLCSNSTGTSGDERSFLLEI